MPIVPSLITRLTGNDISHAALYGGLLSFIFSFVQFFFSPVLGNLSDRFGRRPILLISLFGFGLNYLFLAFAPTVGWLFVGRIISGIMGASFTTGAAYIADISTPEKRTQNFAFIGVAFGVGLIIGPVIGGVLGQFGTRVPFFAAAGFSLLNWVYGFFVLPESLAKENRRPFDIKRANPMGSFIQLKRYPVIFGLAGALLCMYLSGYATQSTWTYFTIELFHWNTAMIGYSLGFVGIMIAIVLGGLTRFIVPFFGQKRTVFFGLIMSFIGFMLLSFANEEWMMFVFVLPFCFGGLATPALQSIMTSQVPANEQGALQGALTSLNSVSAILGPLLMTNLFFRFTQHNGSLYFPGVPFFMGGLLIVASLIIVIRSLSSYVHQTTIIPEPIMAEEQANAIVNELIQ
jgi:DHA1 family tetracycline resistance protein-like MFS transporter